MKFKLREGFHCEVVRLVSIGGGQTQEQETRYYGGQSMDFTEAEAQQHVHKLEAADDEARVWLEAQHLPQAVPAALNLTPEQLRAIALTLAPQLLAALQASSVSKADATA